jgi:glutamate---cysteine ligase / carboxylate-amine ligase
MSTDLTLGVEEEFQIVDATTMDVVSGYTALRAIAPPKLRSSFKPEFVQAVIESITPPCSSFEEIRHELTMRRATLANMAATYGWAIVSAGTHPTARWYQQKRTLGTPSEGDRYGDLDTLLQDVARTILLYGLHVHVGVEGEDRRVQVMNQARTFLPYILALSVNAPFWMGRVTGYQSYRPSIWSAFPMSGIPDVFPTAAEYQRFHTFLKKVNVINESRRIWWDIRIHHQFPTVEFRIADMPITLADTLGIIAYIQALVKMLLDHIDQGDPLPLFPAPLLLENRWRAARYGLRGTFIDLVHECESPATDMIHETLDQISAAARTLGTTGELAHVRAVLASSASTGAEQQLAAYQRRYDIADVTRFLIQQTLKDVDRTQAMPLA